MTDLTVAQIDILRHALGISERNPSGYRNRFSSGPGCDHYADCEALEAAGMMVRREVAFAHPNAVTFFVTRKGREATAAPSGEEVK